MKNKIRPDETFDTFLAEIRENETTVAELAYWFWELLEEYEGLDKALELQEKRNESLEKKCACFRNSQITRTIGICDEDR